MKKLVDLLARENSRTDLPEGLYAFVWRWTGRQQVLLIVLSSIVFPLTLVPLELQRRIVNEAIENGTLRILIRLCAVYVGVVTVQSALKFMLNNYRGCVAESVIRDIRHRVLANESQREKDADSAANGEEAGEGTAVAILSAEAEPVGNFTGSAISLPLVESGTLLFTLGYMIFIEPLLALIGVVLFIPQAVLVPFVQRAINRRAERRIAILREISDAIADQEAKQALDAEFQTVRDQVDDVFEIRLSIFRLKFGLKAALNLTEHLSVIGILFVGGWLALTGNTEVGTVVAFLSGLQRLRSPWRDLVAYYRAATDAKVKYELVRQGLAAHSAEAIA